MNRCLNFRIQIEMKTEIKTTFWCVVNLSNEQNKKEKKESTTTVINENLCIPQSNNINFFSESSLRSLPTDSKCDRTYCYLWNTLLSTNISCLIQYEIIKISHSIKLQIMNTV